VARKPELADEENVEWGVERLGDLECHRHTPTRQPQDQHIRTVRVLRKLGSELPPGVRTITKISSHGKTPGSAGRQ
jgi:hypothetical protein